MKLSRTQPEPTVYNQNATTPFADGAAEPDIMHSSGMEPAAETAAASSGADASTELVEAAETADWTADEPEEAQPSEVPEESLEEKELHIAPSERKKPVKKVRAEPKKRGNWQPGWSKTRLD